MTKKLTDHKLMEKAMKESCEEQAKVMAKSKKKVEPEFEKADGKKAKSFVDLLVKHYGDVLKKLAKE